VIITSVQNTRKCDLRGLSARSPCIRTTADVGTASDSQARHLSFGATSDRLDDDLDERV
jgi:hypothetical protein